MLNKIYIYLKMDIIYIIYIYIRYDHYKTIFFCNAKTSQHDCNQIR